jgi:hypothetical protein
VAGMAGGDEWTAEEQAAMAVNPEIESEDL